MMALSNEWANNGVFYDGTLGSSGNIDLQGPEYIIKAEFVEQKGSYLFHSFQSFDLQAKETAIFQGSSNISNIFSRVTGGLEKFLFRIGTEYYP